MQPRDGGEELGLFGDSDDCDGKQGDGHGWYHKCVQGGQGVSRPYPKASVEILE